MVAWNPQTDTPDLTGKVAVVTGGNAGVGYETVKHLASHGAKVYMVSRNEQRGTEAIARLKEEGALNKGSVELALMDMSLIRDVNRGANEILSKEKKIDILINNAGMLATPERRLTQEGIVETIATNHFGSFVITTTLLPLLKAAASEPNSDVRIVIVASDAHSFAPKVGSIGSLRDLDVAQSSGNINAMKRYGMSKMCSIWFTRELQRQIDEEKIPITVLSVDPGAVASPGARGALDVLPKPLPFILWPVIRAFSYTPAQGAYSSQFAATAPVVVQSREQYHGKHVVVPCKLTVPKGEGTNADLARQLWDVSATVVAQVLPTGHTSSMDPSANPAVAI